MFIYFKGCDTVFIYIVSLRTVANLQLYFVMLTMEKFRYIAIFSYLLAC